jgi:hypothetical protein
MKIGGNRSIIRNEGHKTLDILKVGAKTLHIISHIRVTLSSLGNETV